MGTPERPSSAFVHFAEAQLFWHALEITLTACDSLLRGMMAARICNKVWQELYKLREMRPLENDEALYKDYAAFAACNEVRATLGSCAELPREKFLAVFALLVAGDRMDDLLSLFRTSQQHPALRYACLVALHGVAELPDRRKELLTRPAVVRELLSVMATPKQRVLTPAMASGLGTEVANSADGAVSTITGLFTSNGTLEPEFAKIWVDLGGVPALASSLENHSKFDLTSPVSSDLPLCFFLISTSLLAGAADSVTEEDKLRLGKAWLLLFTEARRWVAREAADLLADFYARPNWLRGTVTQIPEELRIRAVEAARECEREGGSWKRGQVERLATALRCVNDLCEDGAGGLGRRCAGPGCVRVESSNPATATYTSAFKRCSRCRNVVYCSRECQASHWKAAHRKACTASRA